MTDPVCPDCEQGWRKCRCEENENAKGNRVQEEEKYWEKWRERVDNYSEKEEEKECETLDIFQYLQKKEKL